MRALVVDDEELLQVLMRESLERAGWTVTTTGDLDDGLRLAASEPFDLALVDLHLDGTTSGADVCQVLSRRGVPVIVVSGAPDDAAARAAGAFDVLAKPFSPRELVAAAERALARKT